MKITRRELPIVIVNLLYVPIFAFVALRNVNFEFVLYVGVILAVGGFILWWQPIIQFDIPVLWGLTIWGFMHLCGGNIRVDDAILYNLTLFPVVDAPYHILRYDQVVHVLGFGVATLVCHHLLKPFLRAGIRKWVLLSFLIVLMGSGLGAINEVLEFLAVISVPDTNVGGYENTALDLVCNLLGGLLAVIFMAFRRKRTPVEWTAAPQ